MPEEPLVVLHTALTSEISSSVAVSIEHHKASIFNEANELSIILFVVDFFKLE